MFDKRCKVQDWFKGIGNSKFNFSLATRVKEINQKHSQIFYNRTRIIQMEMRLNLFNFDIVLSM